MPLYISPFNTQTMHIQPFYTHQHCYVFPKKPNTLAGFKPGSSHSWGGRDVHCATPPGQVWAFFILFWIFQRRRLGDDSRPSFVYLWEVFLNMVRAVKKWSFIIHPESIKIFNLAPPSLDRHFSLNCSFIFLSDVLLTSVCTLSKFNYSR
jgi:hypothetical protein